MAAYSFLVLCDYDRIRTLSTSACVLIAATEAATEKVTLMIVVIVVVATAADTAVITEPVRPIKYRAVVELQSPDSPSPHIRMLTKDKTYTLAS